MKIITQNSKDLVIVLRVWCMEGGHFQFHTFTNTFVYIWYLKYKAYEHSRTCKVTGEKVPDEIIMVN